ncbi:MAG TPA: NAD(P)H-binding protein, partial [Kofleriaceae bacterium]|nr:NAD(P)H-binding protein [Kofleriaceae bacterium]
MTAFVLGATGFVGREVVRQLCVRGTKTFAHVRPDSSKVAEWRTTFGELGAEVDTTAWDIAGLAARWRELAPAQIYVCIGTTRNKAKSDNVQGDIYEAVDLGLTKLAVDAARASETKPRIVYLSSVGADVNARSAYLRARGKAEDVVKNSGLPWVIARPSIITGDRDESRFGEKAAGVVGDG